MKNYVVVFLIFMFSCGKTEKQAEVVVMTESTPEDKFYKEFRDEGKRKELGERVVVSGDTVAYWDMSKIYLLSGNRHEFLYYSLMMSEEHDYPSAHLENFYALRSIRSPKTDKIANYYLLKAYESGIDNAEEFIKERFPDGKVPTSCEYWDTIH